MKRRAQTEEVRQRVVASAQRLFLEKGYAQTTLREISAGAGVSYGSIYHHFADKEGVFLELVLEGFEKTQEMADQHLERSAGAYLRLALKWAGLIRAASDDRRIAELLSLAYRSWKITQVLTGVAAARHSAWLKRELPDWTDNQFLAATLVLTGAVASMVEERVHLDRLTAEERIRGVLSAALPCFGADAALTRRTINEVVRISGTLSRAVQAAGSEPKRSPRPRG